VDVVEVHAVRSGVDLEAATSFRRRGCDLPEVEVIARIESWTGMALTRMPPMTTASRSGIVRRSRIGRRLSNPHVAAVA